MMIMTFCQTVFGGKCRRVINITYVSIHERLFSNIKGLLSSNLIVEVLGSDLHRDFCILPSNPNPFSPLKHFLSFDTLIISLNLAQFYYRKCINIISKHIRKYFTRATYDKRLNKLFNTTVNIFPDIASPNPRIF